MEGAAKEAPSSAPVIQAIHNETKAAHQNGQTDLLVDVLGDMYSTQSQTGAGLMNNAVSHQNNLGGPALSDNLSKLSWKNNGVLFENDILQIGVKAEYRLNLGRMTLFYGNKSDFSMMVIIVPTLLFFCEKCLL